jgi:hypothetical protein
MLSEEGHLFNHMEADMPEKKEDPKPPCLWMKAGVVASKSCNNFYDCTSCRYDEGMKSQVAKGKQISWQDAMRKHSELYRICRHTLTGRIPRRLCAYDYRCGTCEFDQFFEDVWALRTGPSPLENR